MRGFVTDASSGQALQGATVILQGDAGLLGAVVDADGVYQISGIPAGAYQFAVSFIGFETFQDTLDLGQDLFLLRSVALHPAETSLGEVVVEVESGAAQVEAGLQIVRPTDLQRLPMPDASGDLASYLQILPGVVSLGDRGGQLFIRGGTPAQNLVLMDGALVYQPFHIVGFFSAFPEDIISNVDLYAGGFGARYNGRISSVVDVKTRNGNIQQTEGAVSISPFLAGVRIEGPFVKGSSGYLASIRSSVVEQSAPPILGRSLPYQFGDIFLKLHNSRADKSRCSLTSLYTYDRGSIDPEDARNDVFQWYNTVVAGRCLSLPSTSPVLFETLGSVTHTRNEVGDAVNPARSSSAMRVNTEVHLTRYYPRVELNWGMFFRMNWLSFELGRQFQNVVNDKVVVQSLGGYGEAKIKPGPRLQISPGLALNSYLGDYKMSLDPRLRVVFKPGGGEGATEFSGALGMYTQTLTGTVDERDAGSSFIAWMPAPVNRAQSQAIHGLLGGQHDLGKGFRVVAEGFYKRIRRLPVPIWSTIARFTTTLDLAKGKSYGFDTRLELQREKFYAYLGYGYSWTQYELAQEQFSQWFDDPVQKYHPPHDRRHQLQGVISMETRWFDANFRWQYGSGLPYTRPLGFDELIELRNVVDVRRDFGTTRVLYDLPYQGRLPAYHRFDFSIERNFTLKPGLLTTQLGVMNLYNRDNLFYFDVFNVRRVDQLPLIPVLALKMELN